MKKEIISGIYKITNKINNKPYIGSSNNIKRRWSGFVKNYTHSIYYIHIIDKMSIGILKNKLK